jgi:Lsr2
MEEAVARREVVELIDDLDGSRIPAGEGHTVQFTLDGQALEIDLTKKNADQLRSTLAPYMAAARKMRGKPADGRRRKVDGVTRLYDPKIIRRWAEANQVELPKRGRIPQRIIDQFEAHEEARRR